MATKTSRLREYGMYIRQKGDGTYNLGWSNSPAQPPILNRPTYDEAYNAFEDIIERWWDINAAESLSKFVEAGEREIW